MPYLAYPLRCPRCGHPTQLSGPHLVCLNLNCQAKVVGVIENAAKRSNLDITGLGTEVAEALVSCGAVETLADLFEQDLASLAAVPFGKSDLGTTRARKLLDEVNRARTKPWNVVLHSLGCPGLGEPEADLIAGRFGLRDLLNVINPGVLKMELMGMKGIGEKTAVTFVEWLRFNKSWLLRLCDHLQTEPVVVDTAKQPLLGYTVVLTGTFSKPRTAYEKTLKALGATVAGSVSKSTTILFAGTGTEGGSKLASAAKHNVKVQDEAALKQLIGE